MKLQARGLQRGEGIAPYLFLLPFLIVLGIFFVYAGVHEEDPEDNEERQQEEIGRNPFPPLEPPSL